MSSPHDPTGAGADAGPEPAYRIESLASVHDRAGSTCGKPELDAYLHRYAGQDTRRDYARVYVLVESAEPARVLGYYTLSAAEIDVRALPPEVRRKLPGYPVAPAILLGRLAVASGQQGRGFGRFLLFDAFARALAIRQTMGAWALVVETIDDEAVRFYERHRFVAFPDSPRRLYLPLGRIEPLFSSATQPG